MQEFQTLVLPPVPVARPTNNSTNHNPNSASSQGERRTSLTMSTAPARNNHSHHGHAIPHSHGHHALHSVASEPYPTSKPSSSNKGGVRGRVTVVCAECKRLKLRCSRDRPCTSCIKRACTDRCRYRNDDQPLSTVPAPGEARSIVPVTTPGDSVYRQVSIPCVQCSGSSLKCDRREPCSHCIKSQVECVYPGLAPLALPQEQYALSRLARIEAVIADLLRQECDSCVEGRLKCDGDGRNPCSWCLKRHSGGVSTFRSSSELEAGQQQHAVATGPVCTYSGYSEQARRYGLHSPQSSLHASTGIPSRDRSPYALRISSPPPPSSSHSNTSGGGSNEVLSRITTVESQLGSYRSSQNHNFSHGHSLSHGSATSTASGGFGPSYSASTLTPITPSHPSSLHHYAVSGGGTGGHSHSHSYSQAGHHPYPQPEHHHQRSSSRHSPPHPLAASHLQAHDQAPYHPDQRHESHRPRQLSLSNPSAHLPRPPNPHHTPTNSSTQMQSGQFGFGSSNISKSPKILTPPGSSGGAGRPQSATSTQGTKLPEISNIMTLLSPAPISAAADTKSPHSFPTPVSGVVGNGHGILSMGGGSAIQHLQSDVRGSSASFSSAVKPLSGYSSEIGRRGSTEHARDALPSPSISTTPPHESSGSRPTSAEAAGSTAGYPSHHNRGPSADAMREGGPVGEKQAHPQVHTHRGDSVSNRAEEYDEMEVEIDEIENDMDS